eukprot:4774612-Prymnesium_polylepis.1
MAGSCVSPAPRGAPKSDAAGSAVAALAGAGGSTACGSAGSAGAASRDGGAPRAAVCCWRRYSFSDSERVWYEFLSSSGGSCAPPRYVPLDVSKMEKARTYLPRAQVA